MEHALSCTRGGFHTLRHNEIRNLTDILLAEACHEVGTEPYSQPLNGEQLAKATTIRDNNARLDIATSGFWGGSTESPNQQAIQPVIHLYQAWKEEVLWPKSPGCGIHRFFTTCHITHRRTRQRGNLCLQKTRLLACLKMGTGLFHDLKLGPLVFVICTSMSLNQVPERS